MRLMAHLRLTQPHFVRCIIPNEVKTPGKFVETFIIKLYCSLAEAYKPLSLMNLLILDNDSGIIFSSFP